jgi:hypothetical protein
MQSLWTALEVIGFVAIGLGIGMITVYAMLIPFMV